MPKLLVISCPTGTHSDPGSSKTFILVGNIYEQHSV